MRLSAQDIYIIDTMDLIFSICYGSSAAGLQRQLQLFITTMPPAVKNEIRPPFCTLFRLNWAKQAQTAGSYNG